MTGSPDVVADIMLEHRKCDDPAVICPSVREHILADEILRLRAQITELTRAIEGRRDGN
jgi:hypothetical protein